MNNLVMLMGRLTTDVELRQTPSGVSIARFKIAVDRQGKDSGADFIQCVAFKGTAEVLSRYTKKGTKILASGKISTGSYTNKSGETVYTTEVIVNSIEFCESRKEAEKNEKTDKTSYSAPDVQFVEQTPDDDLPF